MRCAKAAADRVRRIDAHGHPSQTLDDRHVGKVDHVAVRVADVGLHSAEAEYDFLIALAGKVFGRVERFVQRDAEAAF